MNEKTTSSIHYMDKGRLIQMDLYKGQEKRKASDRRSSLHGNPKMAPDAKERRIDHRRLEDVIIVIEIRDDNDIYINPGVFKEVARKNLIKSFPELGCESDEDTLMNLQFGSNEVYVETKRLYRDQIKQMMLNKGLVTEMVDSGIDQGELDSKSEKLRQKIAQDKGHRADVKTSEKSTILGFSPEDIAKENDIMMFKVFVKCLNEVHPVRGDHERDALKQNVSLEQRIIFMAGKHYPKSEKYTYQTIIEQVFTEVIKEYRKLIHLEAEKANLEARLKISSDARLQSVIQKKNEEINAIRESTLEETIRTLYLYLDLFKDLVKVGATKERIENAFKKVNEKKTEIVNLQEISDVLDTILDKEKKLKRQNPENLSQLLSYLKWLKDEINSEVYFVRFLWINNLRGKAYLDAAIDRTLKALPR